MFRYGFIKIALQRFNVLNNGYSIAQRFDPVDSVIGQGQLASDCGKGPCLVAYGIDFLSPVHVSDFHFNRLASAIAGTCRRLVSHRYGCPFNLYSTLICFRPLRAFWRSLTIGTQYSFKIPCLLRKFPRSTPYRDPRLPLSLIRFHSLASMLNDTDSVGVPKSSPDLWWVKSSNRMPRCISYASLTTCGLFSNSIRLALSIGSSIEPLNCMLTWMHQQVRCHVRSNALNHLCLQSKHGAAICVTSCCSRGMECCGRSMQVINGWFKPKGRVTRCRGPSLERLVSIRSLPDALFCSLNFKKNINERIFPCLILTSN